MLYAHATTKTSKTVTVVPCDKPIIVWLPTESSSASSEFTADTFGKWVRSRETPPAVGDSNKNVECGGVLRPCFEVTWVAVEKKLKPVNQNPLCLFTINLMNLAAKSVTSV